MKLFTIFSLVAIFCMAHISQNNAHINAFCSVAVADLVGAPIVTSGKNTRYTYDNIPLRPEKKLSDCPRIAQLLAHEPVEIIKEHGDEVCIRVFDFYYTRPKETKKHMFFWTHKDNITRLNQLPKKDRSYVPPPISYKKEHHPLQEHVMTLKLPFYDKKNRRAFSAGTRFIKKNQRTSSRFTTVYAYNQSKKKFKSIRIQNTLFTQKDQNNKNKKMKAFVSILRSWAHYDKPIPYVFGGCSMQNNINHKAHGPKGGFDCSGMIMRAAHMAHIPLFARNTYTFLQTIPPLCTNEKIESGDLLCWKEHVLVISDAQKGLLIEARGYTHGYGKVHEIPFSEQFKGIKNSVQLADAYYTKKSIQRINKEGRIVQTLRNFTLLKTNKLMG